MKLMSYRSNSYPAGVVGRLDEAGAKVTPLLFPDYRPVSNLQALIAQWDQVQDKLVPGMPVEEVAGVTVLAPLRDRDVLCVGYNYKQHHAEFQGTGFDKSLNSDYPAHPIIFTKRATSIVGTGSTIYPHPKLTSSLDYEGELGIIIGKGGIGISKENAWKHVWGACIINDVTARDRQRDHKQFYIGKSADTFCPMGPYAVPASALDFENLTLETRVNGKVVQKQKTNELIFDIPTLIQTLSIGVTLQPGDVIATGTPEGVGAATGNFLKPGDKVEVTITNLGTLSNTVGDSGSSPPEIAPTTIAMATQPPTFGNSTLVNLPSGSFNVQISGKSDGPAIVFVHGLGGNISNWPPLITAAGLEDKCKIIRFDLEGHGLSPLGNTQLTIQSYANSVKEVLQHAGVDKAIVVAHSMGGLIATTFAATFPQHTVKLFLIGPVREFPEAGYKALTGRAAAVRQGGMPAVADTVATAGTSETTQKKLPMVKGYVLTSLLSTPAEGYAQACVALATAKNPDYAKISVPTLIVAGSEDKTSPKATVDFLLGVISRAQVRNVEQVGHWALLEDLPKTAELLAQFVN